jgi:hypothetical protein
MPTTTLVRIGEGHLTWDSMERVSDRYGTVKLMDNYNLPLPLHSFEGYGTLRARVGTNRGISLHMGDPVRGFVPPRQMADVPAEGSLHVLGTGFIFYGGYEDWPTVGVRPADGREIDWLDPGVLYLLSEQEVTLTLELIA